MTHARRLLELTEDELRELVRSAVRAELGQKVDAPKAPAEPARSVQPTLNDFIALRERRRRRGHRG